MINKESKKHKVKMKNPKTENTLNIIEKSNKYNLLLLPLSIILSGLIITVSILYGITVILDRDQLVTKTELRTVIREELSKSANQTNTNNTAQTPIPTPSISSETLQQILNTQKIILGNKEAPVSIVEIADPSCPYCSVVAGNENFLSAPQFSGITPPMPEIKNLVKQGKANYVWIYYPGAGRGDITAQIFYCAHEKDKFFEVHDKLMKGEGYQIATDKLQNNLNNIQVVLDYIKDVVDTDFIKECVNSGKYKQTLSDDIQLAASLGATGTPNFFINGEFVIGLDYNTNFKPLIKKYISLE